MDGMIDKKLLGALDGASHARPPMWLMRQAGRYLPEYREIRARAPSFLDFCDTPVMASEATLQPINRFGFDAAILFSDILVVPHALGQEVTFETGEGPRLEPIVDTAGLRRLASHFDINRLNPVLETIDRVKGSLSHDTAFIGFCGAPWTLATYMVAGRGTPDQKPARLAAYRDPVFFQKLIDILVDASITYLVHQLRAGVDAVQIFDSWAGTLPTLEFERWCLQPLARIVEGVRQAVPDARIIAFPRGASSQLHKVSAVPGIAAIGLDTSVNIRDARRSIGPRLALQGNLDPLALIAGGDGLDRAVDEILSAAANTPFVFNLGHGILPETPIEHVERLVARVRGDC